MLKMPPEPKWLSARVAGRPVGVDRKANALLGYVVAQEGPFKSDGRGEFDEAALREIVRLGNAAPGGLKSRFTHPDMSSDGLGKFLGRARDFSLSTVRDARTGKEVKAVRADLHFDASAAATPSGDLAGYVLTLAESDPDALSSSLVLCPDEEFRLNPDGTRAKGPGGEPLPPLWRPKVLHASDLVDSGDAVDGLLSASLSADGLPLSQLWRGAQLLDTVFVGQARSVVEARCLAYLGRYLERKFGPPASPVPTPRLDALRLRLDAVDLAARTLGGPTRGDARQTD